MRIRLNLSLALCTAFLLCNASGLYAGDADGTLALNKSLQAVAYKCQQPEFKKYLTSLKGKLDTTKTAPDSD